MKILSLTTSGFRGLPDGEYRFASPNGEPHNLVLVTGAPGSGKTALLQAIVAVKEAVGAYDIRRPSPCVAPGRVVAELTAQWHLEPLEAALASSSQIVTTRVVFTANGIAAGDHPPPLKDLFATFSRDPARPKVLLFHDDRVLPPTRGLRHSTHEPSESADGELQISRSPDKYRLVRPYIVRATLAEALSVLTRAQEDGAGQQAAGEGALQRLRDLFRPFLGDTVFDGISPDSPDGHGYMVRFRRRDGGVVDLDDLAASERQGVLFAATMARCAAHSSLVLVDEPELHIHAAKRARFIEALAALGRDNQIIAATCSTELVKAAARDHVIELSPRPQELEAPPESRGAGRLQAVAPSPKQDGAQPPIEPRAPALASVAPAVEAPAFDPTPPSSVPTYLQAPPAPLAPLAPPPLVSPRAPDSEDEGTVEIKDAAIKPALPFVKLGEPGVSAAPPGKRLIRFDPQTGRPLPEPVWVDAPAPPVSRQK